MTNPAKDLNSGEFSGTLHSIKDIMGDGRLYEMTYTADYRLSEMLKADAGGWEAFEAVMQKYLMSGEDYPPDGAALGSSEGADSGLPDGTAFRLPDEADPDKGDGCTVFSVRNKAGHILIGRNYDFRRRVRDGRPYCDMVLRTKQKTGFETLGMADLSYADFQCGSLTDGQTDLSLLSEVPFLVMDGMNEHGVFIAILVLKRPGTRQRNGKPKIVPTLAMRAALDRARSVGEAVDIFGAYDMQVSVPYKDFHYFAADGDGGSVVIEYSGNEMVVHQTDLVTNFSLTPGADEGREGRTRYDTAEAILSYRDRVMEKNEVMAALQLLSQPAGGRDRSDTLWSAVYDLTAGELQVAVGHGYDDVKSFIL